MATEGDIINKQIAAFNKHDAAGATAFYTEEAMVLDPMYAQPLRGKAAIAKDLRDFFKAFPDAHAEKLPVLVKGNMLAYEAKITGRHQGEITAPDGEVIEPTNRKVTLSCAMFCEVNKKGQISRERRYYDVLELMKQLGVRDDSA